MDFEELQYDEDSHDIENELIKCGQVFVSYNETIIINCDFCVESYNNLSEFVKHVKSGHFESYHSDLLQSDTKFGIILHPDTDNSNKSADNNDEADTIFLNDEPELDNTKLEIYDNICEEYVDTGNEAIQSEGNTKKEEKPAEHSNFVKPKRKRRRCNSDPNLFCNICNLQFSSKQKMEKHKEFCDLILKHDQKRIRLSDATESENEKCKNETNSIFAEPIITNPFECQYCHKKFKNRRSRVEHECLHTGEKLYKCEMCPQSFRVKRRIKDHIKAHMGVRPHKCHLCDAAFTISTNLRVHIKRHLNEKRYKCNYCDKSFVSTTERRSHERMHTGEKPYQCSECGQCCKSLASLNEHSKRHTGLKTVKCTVCDKYFISKKAMRSHAIIHSNKKPHKCKICDAAFLTADTLTQHEKIHSNVKEYICKICDKGFKQKPGLYCHMKSHKEVQSF